MKTSLTRKQLGIAVACTLALSFASAAVASDNFGPNAQRELWTDQGGRQVWKNGYGECWRSAFGPPPPAGECNPAPVVSKYVPPAPEPIAQAPAPVYVAPPPPPAPEPVVVPAPLPPRKDRN